MDASCSETFSQEPNVRRDRVSAAFSFILGALTTCLLFLILRPDMLFTAGPPRMTVRTALVSPFGSPVQSSRMCNRIKVAPHFRNETQGPYNPAAINHPSTGVWHAVMTLDEVWFGLSNYTLFGTYLEGRLRSHPLLLQLGDDGLPFSASGAEARMLDLDISFQELAEVEGAQMYKAADWRPFVWEDDLYLGHWIAYMPGEERMAISRLDLQTGTVKLLHRFTNLTRDIEESLLPDHITAQKSSIRRLLSFLDIRHTSHNGVRQPFRREKNWGFWEENGKLLVLYGILPCTVVLEFDPEHPSEPTIRSRTCYAQETPSILQVAGLDILLASVHLSGNPVPWDVHHGALHREMFVMLHTKHPEYVNWAVRMDRDTHVITHISAGPLLRNQDYRNEGFMKTALVVSSFHVLSRGDKGNPSAALVRIFYGEGDRYGCWLDINADTIVWHRVSSVQSSRRMTLRSAPLRFLL